MAISEFEIKRIEKFVGAFVEKRRPAPHIRKQMDISFKIDGQSFVIYEIRHQWNDPAKIIETPVAKVTYVKSNKIWKLYWMRGDLKWHSYTPCPTLKSLEEILDVIDQDSHACFWG